MIDDSGWMRYAYQHDVDATIETRRWLNRGTSRIAIGVAAVGAVLIVSGLLLRDRFTFVIGVVLLVQVGFALDYRARRARARFRAMHAEQAEVAFSRRGVWTRDLDETTFPWTFFTGWTIRHDALLVLRQVRPAGLCIRLPISVVPEDEWERLTTLLWDRLGPAATPEAVRQYHVPDAPDHASSDNSGEPSESAS